MFSFLHKGNLMMNPCCSQRNFFSALPPLVPVQLPSRMYEAVCKFVDGFFCYFSFYIPIT